MILGKYFTLEEMTRTSTGAINTPNDIELVNLARLVALILDPLRIECGPLNINSGFRSEEVNRLVSGSRNSYHMRGCAADVTATNMSIQTMCEAAQYTRLPFDKLIMEHGENSDWLHIQITTPGNTPRRSVYSADLVDGKMVYSLVS